MFSTSSEYTAWGNVAVGVNFRAVKGKGHTCQLTPVTWRALLPAAPTIPETWVPALGSDNHGSQSSLLCSARWARSLKAWTHTGTQHAEEDPTGRGASNTQAHRTKQAAALHL